MITLGVTGGIGMGKSTCADLLAQCGVRIIDTDLLARQIVEPGQPALGEIQQRFGQDVIAADGHLDRTALARRVFSSPEQRQALEQILHPRIRQQWLAQLDRWRGEQVQVAAVIIPLLFETDAQGLFDHSICVACSPASQRDRLKARGWDDREIDQRIAAQWPPEKKIALSHFVVWTEGDLESHREQVQRILRGIFGACFFPSADTASPA